MDLQFVEIEGVDITKIANEVEDVLAEAEERGFEFEDLDEDLDAVEIELGQISDYGLGATGIEWKRSVTGALHMARQGASEAAKAALVERRAQTLTDLENALDQNDLALSTLAATVRMCRTVDQNAYSAARDALRAANADGLADIGSLRDRIRRALKRVRQQTRRVREGARKIVGRATRTSRRVAQRASRLGRQIVRRTRRIASRAVRRARTAGTAAARRVRDAAVDTWRRTKRTVRRAEAMARTAAQTAGRAAARAARSTVNLVRRAGQTARQGVKAAARIPAAAFRRAERAVRPQVRRAFEVVRRVPEAVRRVPEALGRAWNDVIAKLRQAAAAISGLRVARDAATGKINQLRTMAPHIKDPTWQANYNRVLSEYQAAIRQADQAEARYRDLNSQVKSEIRKAQVRPEPARREPVDVRRQEGGVSDEGIGLAPLAIIGVIAGLITLAAGITATLKRVFSDGRALVLDAEHRKLIAPAIVEQTKMEARRREDIRTTAETAQRELEVAEKTYAAAKARGDKEEAARQLARVNEARTQVNSLRKQLIAPVPSIMPVPTSPTPTRPEVKPQPKREPFALERWLGVTRGDMRLMLALVLLVMLGPRIIEIARAVGGRKNQ